MSSLEPERGERVLLETCEGGGWRREGGGTRDVKRPQRRTRAPLTLCSPPFLVRQVRDCFEDTRAMLEPAGAVSVAGLKKYVEALHPRRDGSRGNYVAISSDASNIEFDILRFIAGAHPDTHAPSPFPSRLTLLASLCSTSPPSRRARGDGRADGEALRAPHEIVRYVDTKRSAESSQNASSILQ